MTGLNDGRCRSEKVDAQADHNIGGSVQARQVPPELRAGEGQVRRDPKLTRAPAEPGHVAGVERAKLVQPDVVFLADQAEVGVRQAAGMARTVALLRRWRGQPERRPQTRAQRALRIGLPLLLNLAWGAAALLGVPALIGLPFEFGLYIAPDLFSVLLVSGVVALAWAIVRTALIWRMIRERPAAVVIASETDDKTSWVRTGQVYERLALMATALNIKSALLNQPIEVAGLRAQFQSAMGLGASLPQLLVRLGYAQAMPRSPRRSVDQVIIQA